MKIFFKLGIYCFIFFTFLTFSISVNHLYGQDKVNEIFLDKSLNQEDNLKNSLNNNNNNENSRNIYFYVIQSLIILLIIFLLLQFFKNWINNNESNKIKKNETSSLKLASVNISDNVNLSFIKILNEVYVLLIYSKGVKLIKTFTYTKELEVFIELINLELNNEKNIKSENRFKNFLSIYLNKLK